MVTGASSGIGYELAHQCVAHGFDLLVCAEDARIEAAAKRLGATDGVSVTSVQADLATHEGIEKLLAALSRPVDVLMLNAGVGVGGAFTDTELDAELRMIALNCCHTVHLAKRIVPEMIRRGTGKILITGSEVSVAPNPYLAVYGATKAFVMSFGEALRYELADTGVTVTVLQPGATETKFFERADLMDTKVGQSKKDDPALVAKQGFRAMMDGKDSITGGSFTTRLHTLMNELLPETTKAAMAGKLTKPGSARR